MFYGCRINVAERKNGFHLVQLILDAANDLALLKADGRFAPLPIAASRTGLLGGTVETVGFPDIGLQGFAPKLAKGEIASLSGLRRAVVS